MIKLGVNIDHVATVRQARRVEYPDVVAAALAAERGGADGITVHLREDRRHIQDADVDQLRVRIATKLNLEMAATAEMVANACRVRPQDVCIVPERRQELTTEGGLDAAAQCEVFSRIIPELRCAGIRVSLFIDPVKKQIDCAKRTGAHGIEIHTGRYCNANLSARDQERAAIVNAASLAASLGLEVHAGHGLDYDNVLPVAQISQIVELNIGHSIIARAVMVGIEQAVREMKELLTRARP